MSIEHMTDFKQITQYGVMSKTTLVMENKVKPYGKVRNRAKTKALIQKMIG